jgi:hypothetical protein
MVPHGLWLLGVPFGIPAEQLPGMMQNIGLGSAVAVTVVPALGSLLTLGLAYRWGQVFPRWVPRLGRRRVPCSLPGVSPSAGRRLGITLSPDLAARSASRLAGGEAQVERPVRKETIQGCVMNGAWLSCLTLDGIAEGFAGLGQLRPNG